MRLLLAQHTCLTLTGAAAQVISAFIPLGPCGQVRAAETLRTAVSEQACSSRVVSRLTF